MTGELFLRRKWTLRAHGRQVVFCKRENERTSHVLMKAFLWAWYLPEYPELSVEVPVPDRYRPDVVCCRPDGTIAFWGEAGQLAEEKLRALARRYRETHLAIAKWGHRSPAQLELLANAVGHRSRPGRCDVLWFPADSAERFIDSRGEIRIRRDEVDTLAIGT